MKKNRIVYFILLLFLIGYNLIDSDYISSIVFYLLLVIPAISFIYTCIIYFRFKFFHEMEKNTVIKGEIVNYSCNLHNESKLLTFCPIKIHFSHEQLFMDEVNRKFFILVPGEIKKINIPFECKYRGSYTLGADEIIIMDFFSIIKLRYKINNKIQIVVYPKVEQITFLPIQSFDFENAKSIENKFIGDKTSVLDIREYQIGDNLNQIHWKLSAKRGDLMVKNYTNTVQNKCIIFLDTKKLQINNDDTIIIEDLLVETTASIVYYFLKNNKKISLIYQEANNYCCKQASNVNEWGEIYDTFANLKFNGNKKNIYLLEDVLNYESNINSITLFMITAKVSEELSERLIIYKSQGYEVNLFTIKNTKLTDKNNFEINKLVSQGIKIYFLATEKSLQTVIEGANYV